MKLSINSSFKVLLAVLLCWESIALAQASRCEGVFLAPKLPANLYEHRESEIRHLSKSEIRQLNKKTLAELKSIVPVGHANRAPEINWAQANDLMNAGLRRVNEENYELYARPDGEKTDIGYCFGKAMYFHLALLTMGLQKESIRKIWAVGPMKAPNGKITWGFHVATVAYSADRGWITFDTHAHKAEPIEHWMRTYQDLSTDQRLRFYVTEPEKFSVTTGRYDNTQLGLNLGVEKDWYRHYFVDLLKYMRTTSLETMGLKPLPRLPSDFVTPAEPTQLVASKDEKSALLRAFGFVWDFLGTPQ